MMFSRTQLATVLLAMPLASAFGPATPVRNAQQNGQSMMTMRVSVSDMKRRGKVTTMLDKVVQPGDPAATKEGIESTILTETTANLLAKMNWKPRKAMIRKVRDLASAYDVPVEPDFGQPMPRLEKEAMQAVEALKRKEERKAHFDKVNKERDERVAAKIKAEAGTDKEREKKAAMREQIHQELIEQMEAREKAKEAEAKMKYDAEMANKEEAEQEAEEAVAAKEEAKKEAKEKEESS